VDGDRTQLLLVDLGGVLFRFDHEHRLNVLGQCLGLPPRRVDELLAVRVQRQLRCRTLPRRRGRPRADPPHHRLRRL
jgi:hypothetical protein